MLGAWRGRRCGRQSWSGGGQTTGAAITTRCEVALDGLITLGGGDGAVRIARDDARIAELAQRAV